MLLYLDCKFCPDSKDAQTSERVSANFLSRALRGLLERRGASARLYPPTPITKGASGSSRSEAEVSPGAAFKALIDQGSVSAAAKWLNQKGYSYRAPLRGGGGKPRNRHFTFDSLYRLLSNPTYIGVRQIRAKDKATQSTQAVWPAMIDEQTFQKAQVLLEAGRRQKTGRESRYPYLLSTRIICGQCQASLIGLSAHGKTTKVPYYGHGTQVKREQLVTGPKERCAPFKNPRQEGRSKSVWEEVLSLIESPSHRAPLFQAIQQLGESKTGRRDAEKREAALMATIEKLATLAKRVTDLPTGVPAEPFYDEMKDASETPKCASRRKSPKQLVTVTSSSSATEAQYVKLLAHASNPS